MHDLRLVLVQFGAVGHHRAVKMLSGVAGHGHVALAGKQQLHLAAPARAPVQGAADA